MHLKSSPKEVWKLTWIKPMEVIMARAIASVPILTGEASDKFDLMMEESEKRRDSIDFSKQIEQGRDILSKADFREFA